MYRVRALIVMINFLRISNNIKLGYYLHSDGQIDKSLSDNIIGICVIPSDFLPDKLARFMSLQQSECIWNQDINLDNKGRAVLPDIHNKPLVWGFLEGVGKSCSHRRITSPYLPDNSFNPEFHKDLEDGNAFQDYRGYINTEDYYKKYKRYSKDQTNVFKACYSISPTYKKLEWYLPAVGELALLPKNFWKIRHKISRAIKSGSRGKVFLPSYYWSSSEWDTRPELSWIVRMDEGNVDRDLKICVHYVRSFISM